MTYRFRGSACAVVLITLFATCATLASLPDPAPAIERAATTTATMEAKLHPALQVRLNATDGPVKAWVFLADKAIAPVELDAALTRVATEYSERAVARRQLRGTSATRDGRLFDVRDLPVARVVRGFDRGHRRRGVRHEPLAETRSACVARGRRLEAIAALPFVDSMQLVARSVAIDVMNAREIPAPEGTVRDGSRLNYGVATAQLAQINLLALHDEGYTGAGVVIGVLDSGFRQDHNAFNNPSKPLNVIAQYDFINNDPEVGIQPGDASDQHDHGTLILGCIGAYMPGECVGGAHDASFILCKTEDTTAEYPAEEDYYVAGLEFAEMHGADVVTSSLGYIDWYTQNDLNGHTAVTTIAVNTATSLGIHCCTAAGNEGHDTLPYTSTIIAPADAYDVIACGAVDADGNIAGFSSDGPTAEGRVKPELVARGVSTHSVSPDNTTGYTTADGTSLSTPLIAAAVACLVQAHPDWTPAEMRDHLFLSADYGVAGGTYDPYFVFGYGLVDAYAAAQDCDDNGQPDVYDIHSGIAQDCQHNDVPDQCELNSGASADCNNNLIPDECDIAPSDPTLTNTVGAILGWRELFGIGTTLNLDRNGVATVSMPFADPVFGHTTIQIGNNGGRRPWSRADIAVGKSRRAQRAGLQRRNRTLPILGRSRLNHRRNLVHDGRRRASDFRRRMATTPALPG